MTLRPQPRYIEAHSSWVVKEQDPKMILEKIAQELRAQTIGPSSSTLRIAPSMRVNQRRHSLQAAILDGTSPKPVATFWCRLYRSAQNPFAILVEFQRRNGCPIRFREMFVDIRATCKPKIAQL